MEHHLGWERTSVHGPIMNLRLRFPRRWWTRSGLALKRSDLESVSREEQAQILGSMIRERLELMGLTLRDLATQIRITTPVLEALERAWISPLAVWNRFFQFRCPVRS